MVEASDSPAVVSETGLSLKKAPEVIVGSSRAHAEALGTFEKKQRGMDGPQKSPEGSRHLSPEPNYVSLRSQSPEPHSEREVTVDNDDSSKINGEERSKLKQGYQSDDDSDSIIDIVSESEVYEAAKQLLSSKPPQIRVNYQGESYLLLGEYDGDNAKEWSSDKIICTDSADLHRGCNVAFGRMRLFFQQVHGGLELLSKELSFEFPDLELVMEEDNMYNKDITVNDVVSIFKIIKDNSIKKCEPDVSNHLTINVSTKPRFVSRYNSLVEMLNGDATFSNIKVFTNDRSHPVVLDESEQTPNSKDAEVIIMSSEGEEADENEEADDNEEADENQKADENEADENEADDDETGGEEVNDEEAGDKEPRKIELDGMERDMKESFGVHRDRNTPGNGTSVSNPAVLSEELGQHNTFSPKRGAEKPEHSGIQMAEVDNSESGDSLKRKRDSVSDGDLFV